MTLRISLLIIFSSCVSQELSRQPLSPESQLSLYQYLKDLDTRLSLLSMPTGRYLRPTPRSVTRERHKFFARLKRDTIYNPMLSYKKINTSFIKDNIKKLKSLSIQKTGLSGLFHEKKNGLIHMGLLILNRDSEDFTHYSSKVYPYPDEKTIAFAYQYLDSVRPEHLIKERLDATDRDLMAYFRRRLVSEGMSAWRVKLSHSRTARVAVNTAKSTIYIKKNEKYDSRLFATYFIHEVLAHARRSDSAEKSGWIILKQGTANYHTTEEGFAMYLESIGSDLFHPTRLHLISAHIVAIDTARTGTFHDIYTKLTRYHLSPRLAFEIALRVKSGLTDTSKPGVNTKTASYLMGYH
ncbi:MAG: flavohemoglobin expression-modulating QEGLA motif protein, partial [Spirochaetota bacterium]|nr:flavohemoglobin expression-modulating QEGLA motif protein [Spirochaetota bacterium]